VSPTPAVPPTLRALSAITLDTRVRMQARGFTVPRPRIIGAGNGFPPRRGWGWGGGGGGGDPGAGEQSARAGSHRGERRGGGELAGGTVGGRAFLVHADRRRFLFVVFDSGSPHAVLSVVALLATLGGRGVGPARAEHAQSGGWHARWRLLHHREVMCLSNSQLAASADCLPACLCSGGGGASPGGE
jgi:hypothetical protein